MPAGQGEDKIFVGQALTKKQAKTNAATAAWAELGSGVTQKSVDNLLSAQRTESSGTSGTKPGTSVSNTATSVTKSETSVPSIVTPTQPKVVMHKQTRYPYNRF